MLEIVIQGRGGQGAQTAGNLLAATFFAAGAHVQSFATYGGARRGTPVSSFIRVDDRPIRVRCDIERADAILCFDATLLDGRLLAAADERTLIVVNSGRSRDDLAARCRATASCRSMRSRSPGAPDSAASSTPRCSARSRA